MNRRRGLSLVETMVAAGMLSLLLTMTFAVFRSGAQIWLTSDTEAELLGRIHALAGKIGRRAERSLPSSLSIVDSDVDPNLHACAFLSASDAQDRLQFDPYTGQPVWTDA
ncbi:MAG: prepilin-type N-terminal cleavage/methylation domain-containing protein, partial [Candidatus Eremiobacteraeota bacterium]|nr:prepilin-type N-terminal cleavage/methylation domain-containing protein [Candidatus Eremiobacteraeota bacterium]